MDPAAGRVLSATTKKALTFLRKKVHPHSFCAPPQCKILATRLYYGATAKLLVSTLFDSFTQESDNV